MSAPADGRLALVVEDLAQTRAALVAALLETFPAIEVHDFADIASATAWISTDLSPDRPAIALVESLISTTVLSLFKVSARLSADWRFGSAISPKIAGPSLFSFFIIAKYVGGSGCPCRISSTNASLPSDFNAQFETRS